MSREFYNLIGIPSARVSVKEIVQKNWGTELVITLEVTTESNETTFPTVSFTGCKTVIWDVFADIVAEDADEYGWDDSAELIGILLGKPNYAAQAQINTNKCEIQFTYQAMTINK